MRHLFIFFSLILFILPFNNVQAKSPITECFSEKSDDSISFCLGSGPIKIIVGSLGFKDSAFLTDVIQ